MVTVTNDYAVLRYNDDVPLQLRVHSHTRGRYPDAMRASDALDLLTDDVAERLHIEERTEEWEEEDGDDESQTEE